MNTSALPEPVTRHASSRLKQRGVTARVADLLLNYGDVHLHAGEGATTVSMSRNAAAMLVAEGVDPDVVIRARRLSAVLGRKGLVTVLRPEGRNGRRYRRQFSTRAGQVA